MCFTRVFKYVHDSLCDEIMKLFSNKCFPFLYTALHSKTNSEKVLMWSVWEESSIIFMHFFKKNSVKPLCGLCQSHPCFSPHASLEKNITATLKIIELSYNLHTKVLFAVSTHKYICICRISTKGYIFCWESIMFLFLTHMGKDYIYL